MPLLYDIIYLGLSFTERLPNCYPRCVSGQQWVGKWHHGSFFPFWTCILC